MALTRRGVLELSIGIALTILAAVINGNFALPLKRSRKWAWENSWALYSLVAFWIVPWGLALFTVPELVRTYSSLSSSQVLLPLLLGMGWGISQVLLGVSVARVGMALTFAIVIGLSACLGTLIPLVALHRDLLFSAKGLTVLVGMMIMLVGIYLCAKAGREREQIQAGEVAAESLKKGDNSRFGMAVMIAIAAGVLTPMLNFALAFGEPILKRAVQPGGASPANATYAVWVIALLGGLPVNLLYCVYLLNRNKTWSAFLSRSYDWVGAVLMGLMWMGSIALYGVATTHLGPSGAAIGWGLFSIFIILAANASGLVIGEWKGVGFRPLRNLGFGLALLTVASTVIAWGKA
jgi:L-rhamnose-H+ transport protein